MTTKTKIIGVTAVLAVSIGSYVIIVRNSKNSNSINPNSTDGKWGIMDVFNDIFSAVFTVGKTKNNKPVVTTGGVTCQYGEVPCAFNPMKCYSPLRISFEDQCKK
jgi:hypothetical protein